MQDLKDKIAEAFEQSDPTNTVRQTAALLPFAGLLLPWLTMDGDQGPMSGAELLAYALTSPERTTIFSTSILAGITLFATPIFTIALAAAAFIKILNNEYPLALSAATIILPLIMLASVQPVTSTAPKSVFGVIFPDWGLALAIIPHIALLAHGLWHKYYGQQPEERGP